MFLTSTSLKSGFAALAVALLAAPAFAQTPPPAPGGRWSSLEGQHVQEMMRKHREERARDLHAILNIRPDQEAAFSAFETSMTPPPFGEKMKHDRAAMETMTTPQKLDMMQARLAEHMARAQQRIAAIKTFYAALSPQQQQTLDALHRLRGEMGGHHGWGHGGHFGGPGEGGPPPPPGL